MSKKNIFKRHASVIVASVLLGASSTATLADNNNTADKAVWHDAAIYTDTSPLEEKLTRFHSDKTYQDAVNALATKDYKADLTWKLRHTAPEMPERYVIFWDAHLNPNMDLNTTLSFGGMDATDKWSTAHNKNMKHIIDCREETLKNAPDTALLLQFMKVRGCANEKIQEAKSQAISSAFKTAAGIAILGASLFFGGGIARRAHQKYKNRPKKLTGRN